MMTHSNHVHVLTLLGKENIIGRVLLMFQLKWVLVQGGGERSGEAVINRISRLASTAK